MSDKVQVKVEGNETLVFHHGLIKMLVLEELKRLNRECTSFLFMSGYEVDAVTLKKVSKPKTTPYPTVIEDIDEEGRQFPVEPMDIEVEPLQETDIPQLAPEKKKHKTSKQSSNKVTRSQTISKGNL